MTWGAWKNWDPTTATEPPADIFPPGKVVQADTTIRPEWIGRIDRPHFLKADEFVVINGESWVLDWDRPETTHVVVRYRVRSEGLTGMTGEEAMERVRRVARRFQDERA